MSLSFSNICTKIDRACHTDSIRYSLANKAIDVNLALDDVQTYALKERGWNMDDFNHSHDPFITIDITAGQRAYHFTYDEQTNLILDVHRVMCKNASTGVYKLLTPVDQQSSDDVESFYDGNNTQGVPWRYDKTGNGIYLDPVPSYSSTNGLKVFISRESSYFISTDTTRIAGIDGLCQDYLYLKPSYEWCRDNNLSTTDRLYRDLQTSLEKVKERYGHREKDVSMRIVPNIENCK